MATVIGSINQLSEYSETARRTLVADECALVVVDIQEKLLPPIHRKDQLLPSRLEEGCQTVETFEWLAGVVAQE